MINTKIGHYEIAGKLGEGGMGVVYEVRETHLDRLVAVKVLPPAKAANPERKRRFVLEANRLQANGTSSATVLASLCRPMNVSSSLFHSFVPRAA